MYPERLFYPIPEVYKNQISQKFGENPDWYPYSKGHNGIDWYLSRGTEIYAMEDGVCIYSGEFSSDATTDGKNGYGRSIRIQHEEGSSIYGHLSERFIKTGDVVKAKQLIGKSGGNKDDPNSGSSTGAHLHAEYRVKSGAPQVPGGFVYGAIDILPLMTSHDYTGEKFLFEVKCLTDDLIIRNRPEKIDSTKTGHYCIMGKIYQVYEIKGDYYRIGKDKWAWSNPTWMEKVVNIEPVWLTIKQRLDRIEKILGIV